MDGNEKNIVIGTAGHVDHGKTALVKVLTGIDTDRLKEEKERGMTIEPGFAYLKLPSGQVVSVIDVPGHEKFIRNMLRGISEVDAVLLVVAADDGVMPQTREHLDIVRLLGVEHGLIVLSKIDLVDEEILTMAREEVTGLVRETFLEEAPLIPFSAKTGEGVEEIKSAVQNLFRKISGKEKNGTFRLPIDRVFTLIGHGTVATGTVVAGKISRGEDVEIYPSGLNAVVRSVQVHNRFVDEAYAGQRVGLNLPSVKVRDLRRGMVLGKPRTLSTTHLVNGKFHYLKSNLKPLRNRPKVKFYSGTSEVLARILFMGKEILFPGETAFVQFRLLDEVCLWPYDRYIVRALSPVTTLGGGMILEVHPRKYKTHHQEIIPHLQALEQRKNLEAAEIIIRKERYSPISLSELAKRLNLPLSEIESIRERLKENDRIVMLEDKAMVHKSVYDDLRRGILENLAAFHQRNPLRDGAPVQEIRHKISPLLEPVVYQEALRRLEREGAIAIDRGRVSLAGHQKTLDPAENRIYQKLDALCRKYGFRPLPLDVLKMIKQEHGEERVDEVIKMMIAEGRLIQLNNYRLIHSESVVEIKRILKEWIGKKGKVLLGEAMEVLGIGRTQTQPIFDYLDSIRFTMRVGDHRILHPWSDRKEKNEMPEIHRDVGSTFYCDEKGVSALYRSTEQNE